MRHNACQDAFRLLSQEVVLAPQGLLCLQAVPLAQKTFRVEADSLHLTLVGRFVYDVMHFVSEAREIASVLSTPGSAGAPDAQSQQSITSYRPITEVCLSGQGLGATCLSGSRLKPSMPILQQVQ